MKKSSILAAMALVAMAGCSNNEFDDGPVVASGETPIIVNTGVSTKAAITTGDDVSAMFALINAADKPTTDDWANFSPQLKHVMNSLDATKVDTYANVSLGAFVANDQTAQSISFTPTLYYDKVTSTNKAYMVGVAPVGTAKTGGIIEFETLDGEQDVMYAEVIDKGTKTKAEDDATFNFEHKTGQVSFKVKKDETSLKDATVTVKSITLRSVRLPKSIRLFDGVVTFNSGADLSLPNINTEQSVTVAGTETGNPVMIAPMETMFINAVITIKEGDKSEDKVYSKVPVKFTGANGGNGVTEGYSSLVTIKVKKSTATGETDITATATVAKWKTGNTGDVELD